MSKDLLPTQYYLEVYENSFINDPSFYINSSTPFSALSVGDYFNHRGYDAWGSPPNTETEKFVISEIEHIFWKIDESHNGHKLMVILKKESYDWNA